MLVTGAAGRIGSYFSEHSADRYDLTLLVHVDDDENDVKQVEPFGRVIRGDITDLDGLKDQFAGQDTILHLAATPDPSAVWDLVNKLNITGCYNAFVAAKHCNCRRVVFASSIHAVSGYPHQRQVHPDDPVNPGDLYGVSKCFGEAMARYMAEQHGLSGICIRIGAFQPESTAENADSPSMLDAFVSHADLTKLLQKCIDNEDLTFAVFHGLSDNTFERMDITTARELLNYQPEDDFAQLNPELRKTKLHESTMDHDSGGDLSQSGIREDV